MRPRRFSNWSEWATEGSGLVPGGRCASLQSDKDVTEEFGPSMSARPVAAAGGGASEPSDSASLLASRATASAVSRGRAGEGAGLAQERFEVVVQDQAGAAPAAEAFAAGDLSAAVEDDQAVGVQHSTRSWWPMNRTGTE